jgi:4-hydroxybenzoate polyprenyltransferase
MWDIRDIDSDKKGNVKTIANIYGKNVALLISFLLIPLGLIVNLSFRGIGTRILFVYMLTFIFILSIFLLKKNRPRFYHFFIYPNIILKIIFLFKIFYK